MKTFFTIIKSDYLQRTRSYAFLITLCSSLAIAYTFVPEPNATYSTIRIDDYIGYYNSAWFGYVTAIMTSIFLSLIGFYLVNSGVKNDINTRIGQIIASTPISNFSYLFSKMLSNFLVLFTILGTVFLMSILLFILYNDGYPFEIFQFIKPYLFITVPSLFLISSIAVLFEVVIGKYSIIQNIGFFFVFSMLMAFTPKSESQFSFDVFGSKIVMHKLENKVREITKSDGETSLNIGYIVGNLKETKKFHFNGIEFPRSFIFSRLILIVLSILIIVLIAPIFHRFELKKYRTSKVKDFPKLNILQKTQEINITKLPIPKTNYTILPLLKTAFLLQFRKGKKWTWIFTCFGMILLIILPLKIAHQIVLPILWFLQVHRISDVTSKEITNNVHYFTFTSFRPIRRLLISQIVSAIILCIVLASPLLIRLGLMAEFTAVASLILGSMFIILIAALLGILSKGKKLFEVLFFMVTYANINSISFLDYFGGLEHNTFYVIQLFVSVILLGTASLLIRSYQISRQ